MYVCAFVRRYSAAGWGPKDLIILLDTSESMQRYSRLASAADAVRSVLSTLTHNDFFNLILVRCVL